MIKAVVFDAANTLIYKPEVYKAYLNVLVGSGFDIDMKKFMFHHKLISECVFFPDVTGEEFYKKFNSELLLSLGIIPKEQLLKDIFYACKNLPWEIYDDVAELKEIDLPLFVFSNFNKNLIKLLSSLLGVEFKAYAISEELGVAKPNEKFYKKAISLTGFQPEELLYIGDSIKLDMIPAKECNMNSVLIDREGFYSNYNKSIKSFQEIKDYLKA
ncbi:HAD family hydrolase [Pseudofulvibacter geojedonensis]|uniref:HAD family hydrolase n=1 Tax=Pseudofulvibacter geojedonensis TaxID=1123758 RepID=A0ABW3HYL9_9FLAO